jgi:outer membrane protein assembly factor BamB
MPGRIAWSFPRLMMKKIACVALLTSLAASLAPAGEEAPKALEQWPHWRGPLATGAAPRADPPINWDEKTNIGWKVPVPGRGSSTPVIWGDRVFVATAVDTGRKGKQSDMPKDPPAGLELKTKSPGTYHQFILMCFDRKTGKVLWQDICAERVPHEGYQPTHSFAAGSPTTDGKYVWVSFGSRGIYCYDVAGKQRWARDLGLFYSRYGFGEASTPVLYGNDLVLNWDQEINSKLIVLDARTGQTRLDIPRDEKTSWNTPLVVEYQGVTQVIVNATNKARSYDLATGKVLWECGGQTVNAIPSAVAADGVAYLMSGYMKSFAVAVPLDARGDLTGANKVLWTYSKGTPYCPSPLLVDAKLYFTKANDNALTCLDAKTGKPYIDGVRLNAAASFYGSPVAAAGRIYLVDQHGVGLVLKQSTKVEVLATNKLADDFDSSPAAVGRQLFLRGHNYLYCIETPKK